MIIANHVRPIFVLKSKELLALLSIKHIATSSSSACGGAGGELSLSPLSGLPFRVKRIEF